MLAQLAYYRIGPGHAETTLDMRLDLRAQTEDETTAGGLRQIPGAVGQGSRAAGEGNGDGGAETQPLAVFGDQRTGQERVVDGLGGPKGREAGRFSPTGDLRDGFERDWR